MMKGFFKILFSNNQTCEDVFQLAGEIEQTFIVVIIFLCLFVFTDIDECAPSGLSMAHQHLANICHKDANCTNTKGSYNCGCQEGYAGNGNNCEGRLKVYFFYYFIFLGEGGGCS